jgi:hypothetical protein
MPSDSDKLAVVVAVGQLLLQLLLPLRLGVSRQLIGRSIELGFVARLEALLATGSI